MKAHVCTYKQTELLYYKLSIWVFNCTGLLVGANLPPTNPSVPAVTLSRSLELIIYICRQIPNMLQILSKSCVPECNLSATRLCAVWHLTGCILVTFLRFCLDFSEIHHEL